MRLHLLGDVITYPEWPASADSPSRHCADSIGLLSPCERHWCTPGTSPGLTSGEGNYDDQNAD